MFLCTLYMGLLYPLLYPWYVIITPMYNVHPYFSLKNLSKKFHVIHGKIWYFTRFLWRSNVITQKIAVKSIMCYLNRLYCFVFFFSFLLLSFIPTNSLTLIRLRGNIAFPHTQNIWEVVWKWDNLSFQPAHYLFKN